MVARHIDVTTIKTRRDTDIAAGFVEVNQFGKGDNSITEAELRNNAHFRHATNTDVPVGTGVWTVAYPLATVTRLETGGVNIYAQSDMYIGRITNHYPERRDWLLDWPCYETDMEIKPGASGGPVCISGSGGIVFGVNCNSLDSSLSHVSSIAPLVPKPSR
jgi:hypothetical protein